MNMTNEQIARLCKEKEQELLNKYFGDLVKGAAHERPDTIGGVHERLATENRGGI